MNYLIFTIALSVSVINIALGIFVLSKNKNVLLNILFAIFAIAAGFWILSIHIAILTQNPLFWGRLAFSVSIISITSLTIFAYVFPEKQSLEMKEYFLFLILPIFFLITSFTDLLVENAIVENFHLIGTFGIAYMPYRFFAIFYILSTMFFLINKYFSNNKLTKIQIKYILLGIGLFMVPAFATNLVLPGFFKIRILNSLGPIFSITMIGFIAYAIVRHQLLDIKIVIQRGMIYTTLFAIIVAFYLFLIFASGYLLQKTTNITILLSAGFTVLVGIFGVPPLERYFRKITDKIFFKDKYDYSESLQELSKILDISLNLQEILIESSYKLRKILRTKTAKIILNERTGLEILNIPIITEEQHMGIISIGEKLSGDTFTEEDLRLLKTFAFQAGVALRRVELYEEIKKHACKLEEEVKNRTAKILQIHGAQEQMMLDISHSLQTPLTIIKGELELLQKQIPENAQLRIVDRSVSRVSRFIYGLLNLAKMEVGTENFSKENVNFSKLIDEIVEYIKVLTRDKNIKIINKTERNIFIYGNKNKLEELVTNLASNGIKYMSSDRKKIMYIGLSEISKNNFRLGAKIDYINLSIEDTGTGIKQKDLPNIFDRFYRVKKKNNEQEKGTGLGLAICKKIAEKHDGNIKVESEYGVGTKFTVSFRRLSAK